MREFGKRPNGHWRNCNEENTGTKLYRCDDGAGGAAAGHAKGDDGIQRSIAAAETGGGDDVRERDGTGLQRPGSRGGNNRPRRHSRTGTQGEGGRYRVLFDRGTNGTINGGGPEMQFTTFNGRILIHKK
jgi:hypothetical protein